MVQEQQDDSAEVMVAVEMVEQAQKQPPPWLTEAVVVLEAVREKGLLARIQQQVRVSRGRMGLFEVCDFALVLLVYAVSQEKTLARCYEALRPCQAVLAALWSRQRLPARATLSRFLRAMSAAAVEALRELMLSQVLTQGLEGEAVGGLVDRRGVRHVVFDVDGTHQTARQRALVAGEDYPPARRRLSPLCAPGYAGRKRGEGVRTRTTVQQAHSREWLGTWGNAGNGDPCGELGKSGEAIVRYQKARGLEPNQAVVRLDGLYGHAKAAQVLHKQGVGFLLRVADYRLLREPAVQAALTQAPTARFVQPDTQTEREVFDVGWLLWCSADLQSQVRCRLLVTRRRWVQEKRPPIGQRHGEWVLELFGTDREPEGLSATDLLSLYFARGGFEQTLSEEDREQEPDRWCSGHPLGQEAWQLLSQGVWNLRLSVSRISGLPRGGDIAAWLGDKSQELPDGVVDGLRGPQALSPALRELLCDIRREHPGASVLEPTPVLEHQGRCYPLHPVDPVANGRHRRPALSQTPPAPTVSFDPPKVQLDQWHRNHPDDEQEVF